jgi:hypothetical protein
MTNERWLRWAISKHFRSRGFQVNLKGARVGQAVVDGEVLGKGWRMAVEIKSGHDDVIRGLGQLNAALANGYDSAALVVSVRHANQLDPSMFKNQQIVVLGVDSKTQIHQIYP